MTRRAVLPIRKGKTFRRAFRFRCGPARELLDLTGSEVVFRMAWSAAPGVPAGALRKATGADAGLALADAHTLALELTPAETRALPPPGARCRFDLERRIGGRQEALLAGDVAIEESPDDD